MPEAHQENQQDETKSSEVTYDRVDPDPATRAEAVGTIPRTGLMHRLGRSSRLPARSAVR
jgi:hypothetical protein